jgi:hypothetical protein
MPAFAPGSLFACLAQVPDPRRPQGQRFNCATLLTAACAAILCGARSYAAIAQWVAAQELALLHALGFTRHPPTGGAYEYLFRRLDVVALEAALAAWVAAQLPEPGGSLRPTPLDGKVVRGSRTPLAAAVHLLAALDGPTGGVLKQLAVGAATNEHKAALDLLRGLLLAGRVVTADAIFCHRDVLRQIRGGGGHYFVAVKDNQEQLKRDIAAAFEPAFSPL